MKLKGWLTRCIFILAGVSVLVSIPVNPVLGGTREISTWKDEFATPDSRWDWIYERGTGYKRLTSLQDATSALEIGITSQSSSSAYSDCSLHEASETYTTGALEMRLRTSDDNGPSGTGKGTRGWGYWDGVTHQSDTKGGNFAWFWSASEDSNSLVSGLRVQVARNGALLLDQPIAVDMREWHTYRVELLSGLTRFYVDGSLVGETTGVPAAPQRAELWIDNLSFQAEGVHYLDIPQDQQMFVNWVSYTPPSDPPPDRYRIAIPIAIH